MKIRFHVDNICHAGMTVTSAYTLYVSPMFVRSENDRYTKHFYAGTQRIASKIGNRREWNKFNPDTARMAGTGVTGMDMHYRTLYGQQTQAMKDCYAEFGVPYNGQDMLGKTAAKKQADDSGKPEEAGAGTVPGAGSVQRSMGTEEYELEMYFYHPDHLGSSSCVTDRAGHIVQRVEYVPFGEVFIEERQGEWHTPYLFNAKEYDEETGLYYYGARYYDPRLSIWISPDPMAEKYPHISPYCYTANNPIAYIDKWGLSLTLAGNKDDVNTVLSYYEKGMGGFYSASLDENNQFHLELREGSDISKMTPQQQSYSKAMFRIINAQEDTKINVKSSLPSPIGNAAMKAVSANDINTLGEGEWLNGSSALIHETYEQYLMQTKRIDLPHAHVQAGNLEFLVTGGYIDPLQRNTENGKMVLPVYENASKQTKTGTVILYINQSGSINKVIRENE